MEHGVDFAVGPFTQLGPLEVVPEKGPESCRSLDHELSEKLVDAHIYIYYVYIYIYVYMCHMCIHIHTHIDIYVLSCELSHVSYMNVCTGRYMGSLIELCGVLRLTLV